MIRALQLTTKRFTDEDQDPESIVVQIPLYRKQSYAAKALKSIYCHLSPQECESAPCLNGGSCQDLVNAFECICLSGYTGEFCEVDIDVCAEPLLNSSLCFNGGKCVDGPGRTFYCRSVVCLPITRAINIHQVVKKSGGGYVIGSFLNQHECCDVFKRTVGI